MSLAAYRATRLLVEDMILKTPREKLEGWLEARDHAKLAHLVTCPWCVGFYVSAAVVAVTEWQTSVPLVALQVPAVMALVGITAAKVDG